MAHPLPSRLIDACRRWPLATGVAAAGIKGAMADLTGQLASGKEGGYAPQRTAAFALWNALYCGFGVYGMYSVILPRVWPTIRPCGAPAYRNILKAVCFDNLIATPLVCLPTYYLCHRLVDAAATKEYHQPLEMVKQAMNTYKAEAYDTLKLSLTMWVPIHALTFSIVPVPLRTHWVAACSFVTLTFMSLLQGSLERTRRAYRDGGGQVLQASAP